LIGEKFQSSGADTMLTVGTAGSAAADMLQMTSFRPKALFANINEVLSYVNDAAGNDLTVLKGAVAADFYGPKVDQYHEAKMQKCVGILKDHGIDVPEPIDGQVPKGTKQPFVSAVSACKDMAL